MFRAKYMVYGLFLSLAVVLTACTPRSIRETQTDNEGSKAHELTHSAQYEKGKVVYDEDKGFYSNTPEGLVGLEIEAYQTEYSINGYVTAPSDEGDVESSLDINEDWIKGIRDPITGGYVYNPEADHNNS